jgi:hypothetical protein
MKGRKDWKKRWFSLRGFTLYYYENESAERCEGFVDLNKGCEVVRQKAVKEDDSAKKQWPLKISVGERKLFVRAATKKERHSWYLFLASRIAHLTYLKAATSAAESNNPFRLDTRLITLFSSDVVNALRLDHRLLLPDATAALARTLPAHDETEELSLSNSGIDDAAARPLAEVLEKLNCKIVNLSHNSITSSGAEDIAKGIATNISLTVLNLSYNKIDDIGVAALAANIAAKPQLTSLDLSGNRITAAGVRALAEQLGSGQHSLPEVLLSNNQLGDDGAEEVAKLIRSNSTVTTVRVSGNSIGNRGATAIASAVASSSSVITLDLSDNNISADAIPELERALKGHLSRLNLSGNKNLAGPSVAGLFSNGVKLPEFAVVRVD